MLEMSIITVTLPYIQVVLSVLVIIGVLLQHSAAGVGGAFGGADSVDAGIHTRRGFEKFLFFGTIVAGILFAASCVVAFLIK
jgi:protein translocase SecG subunit